MTVEGVANFLLNTDCSSIGDRRHDATRAARSSGSTS